MKLHHPFKPTYAFKQETHHKFYESIRNSYVFKYICLRSRALTVLGFACASRVYIHILTLLFTTLLIQFVYHGARDSKRTCDSNGTEAETIGIMHTRGCGIIYLFILNKTSSLLLWVISNMGYATI